MATLQFLSTEQNIAHIFGRPTTIGQTTGPFAETKTKLTIKNTKKDPYTESLCYLKTSSALLSFVVRRLSQNPGLFSFFSVACGNCSRV